MFQTSLETVCVCVPFAEDEDGHFRGELSGEGGSMSSQDRGFCCFSPE